jgi:hypothetical protein
LDATVGVLQVRKEIDRDRQSGRSPDIDHEGLLADRPRLRLMDGDYAEGSATSVGHRTVVV